jgi:hypothetical protein
LRLASAEFRQEEGWNEIVLHRILGGKIPCRGPEAPQSALGIVLNIPAQVVNGGEGKSVYDRLGPDKDKTKTKKLSRG